MWKRMLDLDVVIAAVIGAAVTWPICWLLVYKAGWRMSNFLSDQAMDASWTFMAYFCIGNAMLASIVGPFLALSRIGRHAASKQ